MFAKEQIKISRLLTAHLEAFGASRVGRSGVKFDRLGKTTSGQPIFSVDEETAHKIRATFIIDLAMLRSYGRAKNGLGNDQKKLLLDLALWKIKQLLARPFRYRTQCFLGCESVCVETESGVIDQTPPKPESKQGSEIEKDDAKLKIDIGVDKISKSPTLLKELPTLFANVDIKTSIKACKFDKKEPTRVYYPADKLYKASKDADEPAGVTDADEEPREDSNEEES
jgi:hypothetical protein